MQFILAKNKLLKILIMENYRRAHKCAENTNKRAVRVENQFLFPTNRTYCFKITPKVSFEFWHFSPILIQLKLTCLVTLFDRKLQVFKNSPKLTNFGIFNELLSTQNVNVARSAGNIE